MSSRLRIIVAGLAGLQPVGGMAWHYLQYLVGLHRLGHDVYYHEDTWSWPYHPPRNEYTAEGDYSARFIGDFLRRYAPDLEDRWHYRHLHEQSFGMSWNRFEEVARSADMFLNVSGACILPDPLPARCRKVFLDTDPGYNQIVYEEQFDWSPNVQRWCQCVRDHDRHFTFAENMHGADCRIPHAGFTWQTTRMPVVLDLWPPCPAPLGRGAAWTTIMTWNAFAGPLVYRGQEYQSKGAEFEKLRHLPRQSGLPLKIALGGVNAPAARLADEGWQVVSAPRVTRTPEAYAEFIKTSRGELSPAKHVYVALRSGWFSERTVCYLAAGRPAVVQNTGFPAELPTGEGVLAFDTPDAAADALWRVEADYPRHARTAREITASYFRSESVLARLVDDAFAAPPALPTRFTPAAEDSR